ncbi:MAG: hypothetical protein GY757_58610 [bacterium]|nr:hypothetical protein [bacterium]
MMPGYTTTDEQVEYGLDTIDPERTVEVSLRDMVYIYKTLGELNRFFHQPKHSCNWHAVKKFIGDKKQGAYRLISECYYNLLPEVFPEDISHGLCEEGLYPNAPPDYYDPEYTE